MRASVYAGVSVHLLTRSVTSANTKKASVALAVGVVANAFNQRPNFYSASVYLAQSNLSALVRQIPSPCLARPLILTLLRCC